MLWDMDDKPSKNKSDDRILIMKVMEGKKTLSSAGVNDPRLFTGENRVHAVMDTTGLWYLKYEIGGVPGALKQKFTNFQALLKFAKKYYNDRNIEILEVIE